MKYRWTILAASVLLTACDQPDTALKDKPATPPAKVIAESSPTVATENKFAEPEASATPTPAEQYAALQERYSAAMKEFAAGAQKVKPAERQKFYSENMPQPRDYAPEMLALAKSNPTEPFAIDALLWVAERAGATDEGTAASDILFTDHLDDPRIKRLLQSLSRTTSAQTEQRLEQLSEKAPDEETKAMAIYTLASYLSQLPDIKQYVKSNPDSHGMSEEVVSYLESSDVSEMRIESLYQRLMDDYGDMKSGNKTYAEVTKGALFVLQNLAIGKTAPDIEGSDLAGVDFKLSDYRGKIVVLDFWGDW